MYTTLLFLVFAALPPGQDIYVYVENDPHTASQTVLDALQTPLDEIKGRTPQNGAVEAYCKEIEWLRCTFVQTCNVQVITRDEAEIPSPIDLPGYSFSPREYPTPIPEEFLYHPVGVGEYLLYLSRLYAHRSDTNRWRPKNFMGVIIGEISAYFTEDYTSRTSFVSYDGAYCRKVEIIRTVRPVIPLPPGYEIEDPPRVVTRSYVTIPILENKNSKISGTLRHQYKIDAWEFYEIAKKMDLNTGWILDLFDLSCLKSEVPPEPPQ